MRALSLTQPWATLVAQGAKRIETRSFQTTYRGQLAIHASKGFPRDAIELALTEPFRPTLHGLGYEQLADLPLGSILAVATVADCVPIVAKGNLPKGRDCVATDDEGLLRYWTWSEMSGPSFGPRTIGCHSGDGYKQIATHELAFGNYDLDDGPRWAWLLRDVRQLGEPVPCKGSLGLWTLPPSVLAAVERQLATAKAAA